MNTFKKINTACREAIKVFGVVFMLSLWQPSAAQVPRIFDTHVHFENEGKGRTDFRGSLSATLRRMDEAGISRIIIMPPPMSADNHDRYEIESYSSLVNSFKGRVFAAGGGGSLNPMIHTIEPSQVTERVRSDFRSRAERIVASGAVAFGEIALHHLSLRFMGPNHPYEWIQPDHPLMLLLADISAEKDIPIDLHVDMVPEDMDTPNRADLFNTTNPAKLKANLPAFERLLAHNRNARIIWAHAGTDIVGTRTPVLQRELLSKHPNLYMSLRLGGGGPMPYIALGRNGQIKPGWVSLIKEFPDRFIIGSDSFHGPGFDNQRGPTAEKLNHYQKVLVQFPPELAEAIAFRNAERIFKLPPI